MSIKISLTLIAVASLASRSTAAALPADPVDPALAAIIQLLGKIEICGQDGGKTHFPDNSSSGCHVACVREKGKRLARAS